MQEFVRRNALLISKAVNVLRNKKTLYAINDSRRYTPSKMMQEILKINNMQNEFYTIPIGMDGNCFYRCVSMLIFGKEDHYKIIRYCQLFILIENEEFFRKKLLNIEQENNFDIFFKKHSQDTQWCESGNAFVVSLLINRPIYFYSSQLVKLPNGTFIPKKFNSSYTCCKSVDQPLLIAFHINHFEPIFLTKTGARIIKPFHFPGYLKVKYKTYDNL